MWHKVLVVSWCSFLRTDILKFRIATYKYIYMFKNVFSKRSSITTYKSGDLCSKSRGQISLQTLEYFFNESCLNEMTNILTLSLYWYWAKYESSLCLFPQLSHTVWLINIFLHFRTGTKIIMGTFLLFLKWLVQRQLLCCTSTIPSSVNFSSDLHHRMRHSYLSTFRTHLFYAL